QRDAGGDDHEQQRDRRRLKGLLESREDQRYVRGNLRIFELAATRPVDAVRSASTTGSRPTTSRDSSTECSAQSVSSCRSLAVSMARVLSTTASRLSESTRCDSVSNEPSTG